MNILMLQIPVSQFLVCDDLTSEVDKLKLTENEAPGNSAPPRPQTVSDLEKEENWDKLPQLWFRATKLLFGEGVPVVPLVQVSYDSIFPEETNDPVAKYVKRSGYTDEFITEKQQFGTYENFVNETRGAVGIVTMKKLPAAEESEAIFQIYECFRSKGSSIVIVINYDPPLSTQAEKPRVLRCLLEHCKRKKTKDYMKVAQELCLSMVFQPLGDSEFFYKHIEKIGLQTCKRIAERTSLSSVKDVEKMIKELEKKDPNTSPLSDTAKRNLFGLPFVKGFSMIADTPHIYIHERQFGNHDNHTQVHDMVSPYFGDHYFILKYSEKFRFVPLVSIKPGEAVFSNPEKYGTLGALLEVLQECANDWYGLTCEHVVRESASVMIKTEGNSFSDLGKVVYKRDITKTEKDVALIQINRSFYPTNIHGHIDIRRDHRGIKQQKVRKLGAQTGETYGFVLGTYLECPKYGRDFIFLCPEEQSARFAEAGDSGSVVVLEEDNKVEALSILSGELSVVPEQEAEGSDQTPQPTLEDKGHPVAGDSVGGSASSASDIYPDEITPCIPEKTQVLYSETLTASLDQIINNQEKFSREKILEYIDEVSTYHSLLFVRRVDPGKPAAATHCILCRQSRRSDFFTYFSDHQPPCKKAVECVLRCSVDNKELRDNLANRYMSVHRTRLLEPASKIRLHIQPCELKAEENKEHGDYGIRPKKRSCQKTLGFRDQPFRLGADDDLFSSYLEAKATQEHDDDDDDWTTRVWEEEFKSITGMTFSRFLNFSADLFNR
ncbi:uncharacterized protein LOC106160025 [Lingula anatina]|uniref:Uncharacterized protein LOC106160025 n=1 Tax=Lingula anatina TaxID=7574 RepID=A0A1S3I134_LINAN|nr:uncharacterized protein LOC106160025 [Lingula anatina]|eukprot:XP_013391972.1 uncharacterized protein LOC106160025 [Lingula anatina]